MKNLSFLEFDKYCACSTGRIYSLRSGSYLQPVLQAGGYHHVTLSQDGKRKNFSVHRLIAMAYLARESEDQVVNHIDGNKQNNKLSNLEWVSQQENVHHAILTGLRSGTINQDRSLDYETAHLVCKLIQDSWRNKDISSSLGIDPQVVASIRFGQTYQEIACEYNFTDTLPSRRKISVEKLVGICEMLQKNYSYSDICRIYDVSSATVSKIKHRKCGIYISKNYTFN